MSAEKWFRSTDIVICMSFPLSVISFFFFVALIIAGPDPDTNITPIGVLGVLLVIGWTLALPPWVVVRVVRDRGYTRAPVLWVESILAGVWTGFGVTSLLSWAIHHAIRDKCSTDLPVPVVAIVVGVAVGIAVALTPLWVRLSAKTGNRDMSQPVSGAD